MVTREGQKENRFDRQEVHILSGSLIMLVSREEESWGEKEGKDHKGISDSICNVLLSQ